MMPDHNLNVLLADGSLEDAVAIKEMVTGSQLPASVDFTHCFSLAVAQSNLSANTADVILLDLVLPDAQGTGTLTSLRQIAYQVPITCLRTRKASRWLLTRCKSGLRTTW